MLMANALTAISVVDRSGALFVGLFLTAGDVMAAADIVRSPEAFQGVSRDPSCEACGRAFRRTRVLLRGLRVVVALEDFE